MSKSTKKNVRETPKIHGEVDHESIKMSYRFRIFWQLNENFVENKKKPELY